jgi:hypothetical protein
MKKIQKIKRIKFSEINIQILQDLKYLFNCKSISDTLDIVLNRVFSADPTLEKVRLEIYQLHEKSMALFRKRDDYLPLELKDILSSEQEKE